MRLIDFGSNAKFKCESGGIGRRTGFRYQRRKAWEFESLLSHHKFYLSKFYLF